MEFFDYYLFGTPHTTEEGAESLTHNDTIIAIHGQVTEQEEEDDDDVYADDVFSSDADDDDDDDNEYGDYNGSHTNEEMIEYKSASKDARRQIDHIMNVTRDIYEESREMISLVYKLFVREYATRDSLTMGALEYIANQASTEEGGSDGHNPAVNQQGRFKCLFYDSLSVKMCPRPDCCRAIDGVSDVFLVNKQLDFVYGRVIEHAILRSDIEMSRRAYDHFAIRKRLIAPCTADHDKSIKCCPSEWVLYVNVNSEFYGYCSRLLKQGTPYVDFNLSPQYLAAERLSFYLVLLLCGHMMTNGVMENVEPIPSEHYTQINQWKKLPVWFLCVWYAGHT